MNKEINKEYYYMDRERINRICTVLKYLSLIPSLDRIDVFKNTISTDAAFNLLNIILGDTEWITEKDNDFLGRLKCRISDDYQNLLDYILNNYGEFKKSLRIKRTQNFP